MSDSSVDATPAPPMLRQLQRLVRACALADLTQAQRDLLSKAHSLVCRALPDGVVADAEAEVEQGVDVAEQQADMAEQQADVAEQGTEAAAPLVSVVGSDGQTYSCAWARDQALEPLMRDSLSRFTLYPIEHPDVHELYTKLRDKFWFINEVKLGSDAEDMHKLTPDERRWLENTLAFFAASDGIVLENLVSRVMDAVKIPEARHFFGMQIGNETIHSEMYSELINTLVPRMDRRLELFRAIETSPLIQAKAAWALQFTRDVHNVSLGELLIAYACVEGIMFSSSFACIFNFREKNLFPGLCQANLMISGDEYKHMEHGLLLYAKYVVHKLPEARVLEIVRSAVELELQFVQDALPRAIMGMSAPLMSRYVRYMGNFLVRHLPGIPMPYPEEPSCPLPFMEQQGQITITNFFERRVGEYQKMANRRESGRTTEVLVVDVDAVDF